MLTTPRLPSQLLFGRGARILPVRLEHIAALQKLPQRHRDPFDRLLIAQAVAGQLALITADEAIGKYREVRCVW